MSFSTTVGTTARALGLVFVWTLAACGARTQPPPEAGFARGIVPDLSGARVMVFPVQSEGVEGVDREIAYAIDQQVGQGEWLLPARLREAAARNPGMDLSVDDLPVREFLVAEVERIGDPLFGVVYRLGVLMDATHAVLPIEARQVIGGGGEGAYVELTAAIVEVRSGYVRWFGVVRGNAGAPGDLALAATAAEALARRLAGPAERSRAPARRDRAVERRPA